MFIVTFRDRFPGDEALQPPSLKFEWITGDGTVVTIRPINAADERIELEFVRGLSAASRYFRFLSPIKDLTPRMLAGFINVDFPREMAFIATIPGPDGEREIGVARYASDADTGNAEFAVVVADAWQGKGIGRELLRHLFDTARDAGIEHIEGLVLKANHKMLELMRELGFTMTDVSGEPGLLKVDKALR